MLPALLLWASVAAAAEPTIQNDDAPWQWHGGRMVAVTGIALPAPAITLLALDGFLVMMESHASTGSELPIIPTAGLAVINVSPGVIWLGNHYAARAVRSRGGRTYGSTSGLLWASTMTLNAAAMGVGALTNGMPGLVYGFLAMQFVALPLTLASYVLGVSEFAEIDAEQERLDALVWTRPRRHLTVVPHVDPVGNTFGLAGSF